MKSAVKGAVIIALSSFLAAGHVYAQSTSALVAQITSSTSESQVENSTRAALAAATTEADREAILIAALEAAKLKGQDFINAVARGANNVSDGTLSAALDATNTATTAATTAGLAQNSPN